MVYKTNREIPDGTLRPVSVFYKEAKRGARASIYIRGMVVPARLAETLPRARRRPLCLGDLAGFDETVHFINRHNFKNFFE